MGGARGRRVAGVERGTATGRRRGACAVKAEAKTAAASRAFLRIAVVGLKRRLNQVRHAVREAAREVDLFSRDFN
jgi:hypothetical protein